MNKFAHKYIFALMLSTLTANIIAQTNHSSDTYEDTKQAIHTLSTKVCVNELTDFTSNKIIVTQCEVDPSQCGKGENGACNTQGKCDSPLSCYSDPAKNWNCTLTTDCKSVCNNDVACLALCESYTTTWSASVDEVCGCIDKKAIDARNKAKAKNDKDCKWRTNRKAEICIGKWVLGKCVGKIYNLGNWSCSC